MGSQLMVIEYLFKEIKINMSHLLVVDYRIRMIINEIGVGNRTN